MRRSTTPTASRSSTRAADASRARSRAALGPGAPPALARLGGAGTNGLALSADGRTLYATNGGANDVAVIRLAPEPAASRVVGLIPTGWYPTALAVRPDGRQLFVVNGKSNTGPGPAAPAASTSGSIRTTTTPAGRPTSTSGSCEKAGFLTLAPPAPAALAALTRQVAANNRYAARSHAGEGAETMAFLQAHIRHVIYIVKENRTYDQVLGDLEVGNGDPKLAVFGRAMTPNQHALARQFVDLDAFFDSGESSNTGWDWTTAARTNDWTEREGAGELRRPRPAVRPGRRQPATSTSATPPPTSGGAPIRCRRPTRTCCRAPGTSPRRTGRTARRAAATSGMRRCGPASRCATTASSAT